MNATTNISKEEFLNKIESAKKALNDVSHYDRRYLINDVLLDKLFEIAYNSIPIEWIKKYIDSTLDESNSQMLGFKAAIIKEMIEEWKKENEISVMPVGDNSIIPLDYLEERK